MALVEDDDATFTDLVSKAKYDSLAGKSDELDSGHSESIVSFLNKRFGSVSAFYSDAQTATETTSAKRDGFARIKTLRSALAALDRGGWERSYHQRCFHEQFLNAVIKILFKTDPPGSFERSYPRLLELNNWSEIRQEVLISTPRRFGKTISVCLFVAALMFACPSIEISIYSTCKRISCKLLRNCIKYIQIICDVLKVSMCVSFCVLCCDFLVLVIHAINKQVPPMPFIKQTMDEVEIQGSESKYDTRKLNSYPSKVTLLMSLPVHTGRVLCLYACLGDAEDGCRGIVCEEKTINIPKFPLCVSLPVHTGRVLCLYACLGDAEDGCRGIVCEEKTINVPKFPPCLALLVSG